MTFGIIGFGRFGKLWAQCLRPFGEVKIFDKQKPVGSKPHMVSLKKVTDVDYLFLLVPISQIKTVCKKITPLLNPKTTVVDACSVKTLPVRGMKKWLPKGQPVIATHPLFGPDSVKKLGLKHQKIVVCPVRSSKQQLQKLETIFKKLQLKIIHATPLEHDLQMAKSQALVHFLGRSLAQLKLEQQAISTPDYHALLRINDMVNNDTWQLFYDMQNYNPYSKKIRKTLLTSLTKLDHAITQKADQHQG